MVTPISSSRAKTLYQSIKHNFSAGKLRFTQFEAKNSDFFQNFSKIDNTKIDFLLIFY